MTTMALTSLFKKATNFLGITTPDSDHPPPLDGEIIYCKNNVCVHPPAVLSSQVEHFPGYLNVRAQDDEVLGTTLVLTWIPNSTLKKNPRSIENSPNHPRKNIRKSPRQEYSKTEWSPSTSGSGSSSAQSPENSKYSNGEISDGMPNTGQDIPGSPVHHAHPVTPAEKDRIAHMDDDIKRNSPSKHGCGITNGGHRVVKDKSIEKVQEGERRQRCSSNKSVTSIEMEGENLLVVTEELEDSAFVSEGESGKYERPVTVPTLDLASTSEVVPDSDSESSDSTYPSPTSEAYHEMLRELTACKVETDKAQNEHTKQYDQSQGSHKARSNRSRNESPVTQARDDNKPDPVNLTLELDSCNKPSLPSDPIPIITTPPDDPNADTAYLGSSIESTPTSGPDSAPPSPLTPPSYSSFVPSPESPPTGLDEGSSAIPSELSSDSGMHNMTFPENCVTYGGPGEISNKSAIEQVCGVFSVDLGQMRSLRVFYSNDKCTNGQLVIASRESQYKILHFHHGGLDRLSHTFSNWKFLSEPKSKKSGDSLTNWHQYLVIRPHNPNLQCHPEEGAYEPVNLETWHQHMNDLGQIEDDFQLRKAIFFAGVDPLVRQEMWPFLLQYYPYVSTREEREQIRNFKYLEYQNIRKMRDAMDEVGKEQFWRNVQCTVEKDVVRTDRSHPYFKGEDNPNIDILQNILLNYAVAHPLHGYTQGMSDLLAPVLVEVQNEVDAYWCFEGLMQRTIFVSSPKDVDMDKQLFQPNINCYEHHKHYLKELLKLMLPNFHHHLEKVQDGLELLFCHRWILLCFKREFPETEALRMWEACWAHYQTDYFHLFICLAIISVYGEDVVQQNLPADEMLLHFSSLSMHMNGAVILKKARGLLHQYRMKSKIPCTLDGLCMLCGPGIWDSGYVPTVECVGNHPDTKDDCCPYGGKVKT